MADSKYAEDEFLDLYRKCLERDIEKLDRNLSESKYTEYSKVIITLESLGVDTISEYPDFFDRLHEFDKVNSQGMNGSIWSLIALCCSDKVYDNNKDLAQKYGNYIIENRLEDGGYNVTGDKSDVDVSAMAVIALSNYEYRIENSIDDDLKNDDLGINENLDKIKETINNVTKFILSKQNDEGFFESMDTVNSESLSYAVIAMGEAGVKDFDYNRAIQNIFE